MKREKNQKDCDKLLTPIIIKEHPICFLYGYSDNCTRFTQVAHHFVHKSKSLSLRYDFKNLIWLCHHCHQVLHYNESFWAGLITKIKGIRWFSYLQKKKQETMRYPDYPKIYRTLQKKLNKL